MSSAGDGGRWRRAGGNQQQQQNPRQQQQQQSSSRDRSNQNQSNRQSASGPPGNVWANRDKSSGTATPTSAGGQAKGGQQSGGTTTPAGLAEDRHVPLKDFNAGETKQFLKKSYQDAVGTAGDAKSLLWKPQDGTAPTKSAWGTRPDRMQGGRDFWNMFRNQVNALEQGKST